MKIEKIQNNLHYHIATIINNDINNPRIDFVTVIAVKTSKDLDLATIYINVLNKRYTTSDTLDALNKATGYIKTLLAKKMQIRKIPHLKFVLDKTLQNANHIEELIKKIK